MSTQSQIERLKDDGCRNVAPVKNGDNRWTFIPQIRSLDRMCHKENVI